MNDDMKVSIEIEKQHGLENNRAPLFSTDGVPHCSYDACAQYDGKRCREIGQRAGGLCEPQVAQMARDLAAYRAHYVTETSADARVQAVRALVIEACDIAENYNVRGHNDYDEDDEKRIVEIRIEVSK